MDVLFLICKMHKKNSVYCIFWCGKNGHSDGILAKLVKEDKKMEIFERKEVIIDNGV